MAVAGDVRAVAADGAAAVGAVGTAVTGGIAETAVTAETAGRVGRACSLCYSQALVSELAAKTSGNQHQECAFERLLAAASSLLIIELRLRIGTSALSGRRKRVVCQFFGGA